jgi:hypothetical protein
MGSGCWNYKRFSGHAPPANAWHVYARRLCPPRETRGSKINALEVINFSAYNGVRRENAGISTMYVFLDALFFVAERGFLQNAAMAGP